MSNSTFVGPNSVIPIEDQCQINPKLFRYKLSCRTRVLVPFFSFFPYRFISISDSHWTIIHLLATTNSSTTIWFMCNKFILFAHLPDVIAIGITYIVEIRYSIMFRGSISNNITTYTVLHK